MAEEARQQEREAAGHRASTASKQRDGSGCAAGFLLSVQIQTAAHRDSQGDSPPPPFSINLI